MSSYDWATPRKAFEYYLEGAGRTPADLWHAVHDGHIRTSIMDTEFSGDQVRALLKLIHWNVPESERGRCQSSANPSLHEGDRSLILTAQAAI